MCVIIAKPAGAKMPSFDELKAASKTHPHGMGFASPRVTYKGFNLDTMYRRLQQVRDNEPCIIHFRFATHGSVCRANCHPFRRGDVFFAHNGVLSIAPVGNMTDSETAFIEFVYPAIKRCGYDSIQVASICQSLINGYSKFALLKGRELRLFGDFTKHEGRYYSNTRHLHLPRWAM